MEYLDIIDEHDTVIGKATRPEVYERKLMHRIVHIFVMNNEGKMLVQKRSPRVGYLPGAWSTAAAGHPQAEEKVELSAERELAEELGISAPLTLIAKEHYFTQGKHHKILYVYTAQHEGPFSFLDGEVSEVRFFTKDEIKERQRNGEVFHPELLFLIEKYFS